MSWVGAGVPAGDRAVFGRNHETGWTRSTARPNDKAARAVEDVAGWRCCRSSRTTCGGRDSDHERHCRAIALVQGRYACAIVSHPPGGSGAVGQTPAIKQVWILKCGAIGKS